MGNYLTKYFSNWNKKLAAILFLIYFIFFILNVTLFKNWYQNLSHILTKILPLYLIIFLTTSICNPFYNILIKSILTKNIVNIFKAFLIATLTSTILFRFLFWFSFKFGILWTEILELNSPYGLTASNSEGRGEKKEVMTRK